MQITELAAKLQSLGLSDKEAKVYVASLFLGPAAVQKIAEQAGVNRATAYVILDQLGEIGLVSQSTEDKKTVFVPEGPEALERWIDSQETLVKSRRSELKTLLPELKQTARAETEDAPVVRFYKGLEGAHAITDYARKKAKPGSEIYSLMNADEIEKQLPGHLATNPSRRLKKRISSRVIYSYAKDLPTDPKILRQTYKIEHPVIADIDLYEDRASLVTYGEKNTVGILIESKEIVGALRQLFELAWKNQEKK
jgi:HTH-type transcriptional regulator, sugar sensing transcriptional regulator